MADAPGVELRGFGKNPNYPSVGDDRPAYPPSHGPGSWSESSQMGGPGINPTYQTISEPESNSPHSRTRNDSGVAIDPSSGDRMYDFVPNNGTSGPAHVAPPVPPDTRRTTMNQMYESRGDTFSHPNIKGEKPLLVPDSISDEDELEGSGSSCIKTICLSILVLIGLLLAIVAVVLVMLLWFGVYNPQVTSCPVGGGDSQPIINSDTPVPTPSAAPCNCSVDLQPLYDEIEAEATNLTKQIEALDMELDTFSSQSMAVSDNLTSQANVLQSEVDSINTSCYNTLDTLLSQNVSLAGLNFQATLMNVGVYNSCIYEYLDKCTIDNGVNTCQTGNYSVLVENYFNIDLACHVSLESVGGGQQVPEFAPVSNLRFTTMSGETLSASPDADETFTKSNVRCECAKLPLVSDAEHLHDFDCHLFRARCPKVMTVNTTITTPE